VPFLELDNVVAAYGKVEALRGLTLHVEEGEIVALLGSNGAGKSTTLRAISGLVRPRSGALRFAGEPLAHRAPEAIVRLGIAHVPEGRRIFPGLTVRENIVLGGSNRPRAPKTEIAADVERMFAIFPEIRPFADALGWTLSGGQQQMVAIARGLMSRPRAAHRAAGLQGDRRHPRERHHGAVGRAERAHGALARRPGLCPGDREPGDRRQARRALE
jgi:branched-chain amino acid transport system ATP-binding protein